MRLKFNQITMSTIMLIVFIIATTLSEIVCEGADEIEIVAEGGNEIKIEAQGDNVIKIVVQADNEVNGLTAKSKYVTSQRTTKPLQTDTPPMQKVAMFQNYGYPKPKDVPILNRKIFKGTRVTIREHPYVVSIRRLYSHYVPGSLIKENLVLTVAHPLHRVSVRELGVVVGENYSDRGTSINPVIFLVFHEEFDPYVLANDIAILRTYDRFFISTNVKTIKFHIRPPPVGSQAFVTGWGRCDFTGSELCLPRSNKYYPREVLDPMLRTVTYTVTNNSYCDEYEKNEVPLKPGMMCMGISRFEEYMTSCLAVPGSPQVVHGRLTGILSWGVGCGYSFDMPLVYVNLFHYRKWLHHNMDVLLKISKEETVIFNLATKAYIIQQWVNQTKKAMRKPWDSNEHDLQTFELDIELAHIKGTIYDIRDFLYDGKYHRQKQALYSKIKHSYNQITASAINYSVPLRPFLSKERLQKLGIHISHDGNLVNEDYEDYDDY